MRIEVGHGWHAGLAALAGSLLFLSLAGAYSEFDSLFESQRARNVQFLEAPSLAAAVADYGAVRPPGYPIVLRAAAGVGVDHRSLNKGIWCALIFVLCALGRHFLSSTGLASLALLLAIPPVHHAFAAAMSAELLFTLLAAAAFAATLRFKLQPNTSWAIALGTICASALLVRYFAAFSLIPLVLAHVVATPSEKRVQHVAAFALALGLVAAPWLVNVKLTTGYWSGMDRFSEVRQEFHGSKPSGPRHDFVTTAKSPLVAYFSPRDIGARPGNLTIARVNQSWAWSTGAGLFVIGGLGLAEARRRRREPGETTEQAAGSPENDRAASDAALLSFQFALVLPLATLLVNLVGNNDPLSTRFLFPAFPFLVLAGFGAYGLAATHYYESRFLRLAICAFGLGTLWANLAKHNHYGVISFDKWWGWWISLFR